MTRFLLCLLLAAFLAPLPAAAQDPGMNEVVVTGSRRQADDFDSSRPAIGLRRTADFAVLPVTISGDTRDEGKRHDEIFAMIKGAIDLSGKYGVQLATGEFIIEPLTLANYGNLSLGKGDRTDTNAVTILVKTPLTGGADGVAALQRIERFVKAVPPVGRAEMKASDELTLSVVAPDQYRSQILDLVAADAKANAARYGSDYAVEAKGLDRPVEWARATLTDVFLYIPYNIVIRPKD